MIDSADGRLNVRLRSQPDRLSHLSQSDGGYASRICDTCESVPVLQASRFTLQVAFLFH